ncbi:MAG: hypothetical protein Q8O79_02225 [Pseudomonadota bacterium]|nr:hypothetical protein [Pseudomonadota bacterium]
MSKRTNPGVDTPRLIRHADALRNRLLRRWVVRGLRRMLAIFTASRAEGELCAMDARELHDLGLDRGGIAYTVRHGRERMV